jgi:AhpD family alkylhydroperoxidase
MAKLPKAFRSFQRTNAAVVRAYEALGEACAKAGPLEPRTRELVKLGLAIGARLEGAVHAHVRRARAAGASPAQIRHVVALAAPTLGFPTTVAVHTWVEEELARTR